MKNRAGIMLLLAVFCLPFSTCYFFGDPEQYRPKPETDKIATDPVTGRKTLTKTFTPGTYNWTLPDEVSYGNAGGTVVEIYAAGGGGGGQGGNFYGHFRVLWATYCHGTGGAGGGGGAAYMTFTVTKKETFAVEVGGRGAGGNYWGSGSINSEYGYNGEAGGTTTVSAAGYTLQAGGGAGGGTAGQISHSGGAGGAVVTPLGMSADSCQGSAGSAGQNGADGHENKKAAVMSQGGGSGKVVAGSLGSYGGLSGPYNYNFRLSDINGPLSGAPLTSEDSWSTDGAFSNNGRLYAANPGVGGNGGYSVEDGAQSHGAHGGEGEVKIIVTWYEK